MTERKRASLRQNTAWLAPLFLVLFLAPFAMAQQGPGGNPGQGGPPGGNPGQGGPPGGGDEQGSHAQYIQYDEGAGEYVLSTGKRVPADDVERSLSTEICAECHENAIAQLKSSVHFKVQGGNSRILFPGGGAHGALDRACGLPGTTALINYTSNVNLGECGKCHVGRFIPPMQDAFTSSFTQMFMGEPFYYDPEFAFNLASANAESLVDGGLDCLICHADHYLSVRDDIDWNLPTLEIAGYAEPGEHSPSPQGFGKLAHDDADFDHDGSPDLVIDVTGDGIGDAPLMQDLDGDGMPETPWPTVMQDRSVEAVLSVGPTEEHHCLRCHEHARTGYKRGTLFRVGYDAHANVCFPDPRLTADNPNCPEHNTCTACHVTLEGDYDHDGLEDVHKFVRGHLVGGDLAAADYPPPPPGEAPDPGDPTHLTCVQCHNPDALPQRAADGVHAQTHLDKIACETCHITRSGGITFSVYGHGGHVSFGRNAEGQDTKLITLDHMVAEEDNPSDIDADFEAFRLNPVLMWFNGSTSFLAQSLAIRGAENAKITPFKPMANGMVMDGRFFTVEPGDYLTNEAGFPYNPYSMYRFFANAADCDELQLPGMEPFVCSDDGKYGNAEVFSALGLLGDVWVNDENGDPTVLSVKGQTPEEVRTTTLLNLMDMDRPDVQTMAMMQAFPNLMNFSKTGYGYEHYLVSSALAGSPADVDGDGVIDEFAPYLFKMFDDDTMNPGAVNVGLMEFKGFNQPMYLPPTYDWYPFFDDVSNVATMKLPDGKFMKLFLGMQLQMAGVPMETIGQLIGNYPAFSNGVTLGGHGIVPNPQQNALGSGGRFGGCQQCHVEGSSVLESQVPVTKEQYVETPMGMAALPVYRWKYYNIHRLIHLGLTTNNEDVVAGTADIDIAGDTTYVRESTREMVLNWFDPGACEDEGIDANPVVCFLQANSDAALAGTGLDAGDLTWEADECGVGDECPEWMPVLEPVTEPAPNYAVLGYAYDEVIWDADDPRINPGPPGGGEEAPEITGAEWYPRNQNFGRLEVEGIAGVQDRVEIINGETGDLLFRLRADRKDGTFEVERNLRATRAPCTVAARVDDLVGEAVPVENAPEACVGAP
ncbi:MAG: hypothetical protein P8Z78_14600 [Gammaproteobacteria bacterium]